MKQSVPYKHFVRCPGGPSSKNISGINCCIPRSRTVMHGAALTAGAAISLPLLWWLIRYFLVNNRRCPSRARVDGKVVVITGANTGIGKETARELAGRGAKVVLACRNIVAAQEAADEINAETGKSTVSVVELNLSSLSSVRKCGEAINRDLPRIDILINNAGVAGVRNNKKTEDGFQLTFQVNHLGHFLLTNLVLDKLKSAASARVINVSSGVHMLVKNQDMTNIESLGSVMTTPYNQSKLYNVWFTRELARRMKDTGVTVYALHPGAVSTDIWRNSPIRGTSWIGSLIQKLTLIPTEMGAQTSIYCAVAENLEQHSGCYFSDCGLKAPSAEAQNDEKAAQLWDISAKMVGL